MADVRGWGGDLGMSEGGTATGGWSPGHINSPVVGRKSKLAMVWTWGGWW